jgi:hypothetical protein
MHGLHDLFMHVLGLYGGSAPGAAQFFGNLFKQFIPGGLYGGSA